MSHKKLSHCRNNLLWQPNRTSKITLKDNNMQKIWKFDYDHGTNELNTVLQAFPGSKSEHLTVKKANLVEHFWAFQILWLLRDTCLHSYYILNGYHSYLIGYTSPHYQDSSLRKKYFPATIFQRVGILNHFDLYATRNFKGNFGFLLVFLVNFQSSKPFRNKYTN